MPAVGLVIILIALWLLIRAIRGNLTGYLSTG
jgi:hypothetical protein